MLQSERRDWVKFNADGVLLAILAFIASFDLFEPDATDMARRLGYIPPSFYLWTILYVLGGCVLLVGFLGSPRVRMPCELAGRLLLCVGVTIETWRTATIFGWLDSDTLAHYLIALVLVVLTIMRASLLLRKTGTVVVVGGGP